MEKWEGAVAVVTGASSGLGLVVCQKLVEKGLKVVGLARRKDRLDELSKSSADCPGRLYPIRCNICREEEILKSFKTVKDRIGPVQILINIATLVRPTSLIDGSTEDWRRIYDVNVIGLCICTRETVKVMMESPDLEGHVVNINAVSHVYASPNSLKNVFPSSKQAVSALMETLRQELGENRSKRIKASSINGGIVKEEAEDGSLSYEDVAEALVYVLSTSPAVQVEELVLKPICVR